jgi:K(+)-stimulated pyrophosphate-energized sodium pump
MNILIKLTCLIGLVIAPILGGHTSETAVATNTIEVTQSVNNPSEKKIEVRMKMEGELATATVTIETSEEGKVKRDVKELKGSEAEVKAEIEAIKASIK